MKYLFYPTVHLYENVAPFAGAWIEILSDFKDGTVFESLPSRERGLKYYQNRINNATTRVAPFAGAWIEITDSQSTADSYKCRSLRGSVD